MKLQILSFIVLCFIHACQQEDSITRRETVSCQDPKTSPSGCIDNKNTGPTTPDDGQNTDSGNTDNTPLPGAQSSEIIFQLSETDSAILTDASYYTVASFEIAAFIESNQKKSVTIESTQITYKVLFQKQVGSNFSVSSLSTEQTKLLQDICTWIKLEEIDIKSSPAKWQITWRAAYEAALKEELAKLELAQLIEISCAAVIELKAMVQNQPSETSYRYIIVDPIPLTSSKYLGATDQAKAINWGLALIDQKLTFNPQITGQVLDISPSEIKDLSKYSNIPAIHPNLANDATDLFSIEQGSDSTECQYNTVITSDSYEENAGQVTFIIKEQTPLYGIGLNKSLNLTHNRISHSQFHILNTSFVSNSAGVLAEECKTIGVNINEDTLNLSSTCEQMVAAKDKGCVLEITIVNQDDTKNTVKLKEQLNLAEVKTEKATTAIKAAEIFPKMDNNPIREGTLNATNFQPFQTSALAYTYDFNYKMIGLTDFETYIGPVDNHIYEGAVLNCQGASAYVVSESKTIHWCPGGMPEDQTTYESDMLGYSMVFRAIILFHEALHVAGLAHDVNANYEPCKGTAYSASLGVKLYQCSQPYCKPFNGSFAVWATKQELEYSMGNNSKRYQGLCQEFQDSIGITIK